MSPSPIIYLGPSLPRHEAEAAFPGSDIRGPVRRGDLYRDRELGGTVFVMIDGVFLQRQAVPPREVLDVLQDGALIVGASSMGALRAAECWPAGMRGIGSIYRLFRRGSLESDDEVAVVFDADGYRPLSVPLINVRYAASRAVHGERIDRASGNRIARVAQEIFYPRRSWQAILDGAGIEDAEGRLEAFLANHDLKKLDALRALRAVSRWLAADPVLAHRPRRSKAPFKPSEHIRERGHDALAGGDPEEIKRLLCRWQLVSGRYMRPLLAIVAANPDLGLATRIQGKDPRTSILTEKILTPAGGHESTTWIGSLSRQALMRSTALRMELIELWGVFAADEAALAEQLWAEFAVSGELDAEIFRWRAIRAAALKARELGLAARPADRFLAETEIASTHGFLSWSELRQTVQLTPSYPWSHFVDYRDELALAKHLRERLFESVAWECHSDAMT